LAETVPDEIDDLFDGALLVLALGNDLDPGTLGRREHHYAHDALAIDPFLAALHENIALELRGESDQTGGSPGMQPQPVHDLGFATHHHASPAPRKMPSRPPLSAFSTS